MPIIITDLTVCELRFPTSDNVDGSDAIRA